VYATPEDGNKPKKVKLSLSTPWRQLRRVVVQLHSLLTSGLIGGGVGPRAFVDILERRKISCLCQHSNPRSPCPYHSHCTYYAVTETCGDIRCIEHTDRNLCGTKGNTTLTPRKSLGKQRRLDINIKTDLMEIQCLDSKQMALAQNVSWVFFAFWGVEPH
jgi:hypothetical protein